VSADSRDRLRIAQVAARLIALHGIRDWSQAKRKAARELMLGEREPMPGDDEVEDALVEYHAIFGGEAHAEQLRGQREEALRWMRRLAAFRPQLTGGVAAGWATRYSDIRLELEAEDAKLVEIALLGEDVPYRSLHSDRDGASDLYIDTPRGGVRLSIGTPEDARQRPRRKAHGRVVVRLDTAAVAALLDA